MCPVYEYGLFYFYLFLFYILEVGQSDFIVVMVVLMFSML